MIRPQRLTCSPPNISLSKENDESVEYVETVKGYLEDIYKRVEEKKHNEDENDDELGGNEEVCIASHVKSTTNYIMLV